MRYCLSRGYLESDHELNREYKKRMKKLKLIKKKKLLSSQKNWLKRRENKCTSEYELAEGGHEAPIYLLDCYVQEKEERINFLKNYR
nr:lysozyme inhibitor LprI family protein [Acinetobacter sp. A1]